jgi:hypothetical protein
MIKYILLTIVTLSNYIVFSQEKRTNAKFMDTCKLSVIAKKTVSRNLEISSDSIFKMKCNCSETRLKLNFFDRWGKIIYSESNINNKISWKDFPKGKFFWVIETIYPNGTKYKQSDFIEITD